MARILLLFLLGIPAMGSAAGGSGFPLEHFDGDLTSRASLQRGAMGFVNYCLGCHTAAYQRYSRIAEDLGLSEEQVVENLIFTREMDGAPSKVGSLMHNAMSEQYGETAFGKAPPDLSVISRVRGEDWLYTYLLSFYRDNSKTFGVNNAVFPGVGMPNVLEELQGWQEARIGTREKANGNSEQYIEGFDLVSQGSMTPEEYRSFIRDLVNFMSYMGEPAKLKRQSVGIWVILFLLVFAFVAYLLKHEYWREVH